MRSLTSIALSVIFSLSAIFAFNHYTSTAGYKAVRDATVALTVPGMGDQEYCSGVAIGPELVLTAAHCKEENMSVEGKTAVVVKVSIPQDLMLLYVVGLKKPYLKLAKAEPSLDEKVAIVGFPIGYGEVATEGRMQNRAVPGLPGYMLVSAPAIFGNSGGPVVVRRGMSFEVVGIVSRLAAIGGGFVMIPITHLIIVTDTTSINRFINE